MLYGELVTGTRTVGRPYLRYRDTCKRDMKVAGIDTTTWEAAADDRGHWRAVVKAGLRRTEENRSVHEAVKREKRKEKYFHPAHSLQPTIYICHKCGIDCHPRVGGYATPGNVKAKTKQKIIVLLFLNIYLLLCRPLYRFIFVNSS